MMTRTQSEGISAQDHRPERQFLLSDRPMPERIIAIRHELSLAEAQTAAENEGGVCAAVRQMSVHDDHHRALDEVYAAMAGHTYAETVQGQLIRYVGLVLDTAPDRAAAQQFLRNAINSHLWAGE